VTIETSETDRTVRDYAPSMGMAFQGDVAIVPVPAAIIVSRAVEIDPVEGRLIRQEGEATGHHHAIALLDLPVADPKRFEAVDKLIDDARAGRIAVPTARMFRDPKAAQAMIRADILTRADFCVGFLIIEGGPMVVTHPEHDGIRIPPGTYYVGRQIASAFAEGQSRLKTDLSKLRNHRRSNDKSMDEVVNYVRSLRDEWTDRER
jgi:hypothetical protein